ncbi:nuclear transport factor 2 family protein [Streptomyces turgidiscabies]
MPARRILVAALAASALLGAATVPAVASPSAGGHHAGGYGGDGCVGDGARLDHQKDVSVRVLKGVFERGDTAIVDRFVRPDYIQHNPFAADGSETLKNLGVGVHQQFPQAKYDVKRVISEGDLVLVHSNVVLTPGSRGSAVFDIFRFQGGKIAEHWDTGQNVPDTSANGNDMFSTVSRPQTGQPGARWLTAYNKKLVTKAFDQLIVDKDLSALDRYWGPQYHQHNPSIADGVAGVREGLGGVLPGVPGAGRLRQAGGGGRGSGRRPQPLRERARRARAGRRGPVPGAQREDRRALGRTSGRAGDFGQRQHDVLSAPDVLRRARGCGE